MGDIKLPPGTKVLDMESPDFVEQFTAAIGAEPGDEIRFVTTPRERTADMAAEPSIPADDEAWRALAEMSVTDAKELGLGSWDGGLFLLPTSWFTHVPAWLEVEDIFGETARWDERSRDDESRFGCLAYGIRVGPSTDGYDD